MPDATRTEAWEMPAATRRLFQGYDPVELTRPEYRGFLLARLLEEGDGEDLRWLLGRVDPSELRSWLEGGGARQLSRRSSALWARLLGADLEEGGRSRELWPL